MSFAVHVVGAHVLEVGGDRLEVGMPFLAWVSWCFLFWSGGTKSFLFRRPLGRLTSQQPLPRHVLPLFARGGTRWFPFSGGRWLAIPGRPAAH